MEQVPTPDTFLLLPSEVPDVTFYSNETEDIIFVLGKEYAARRYCSDGYNKPKVEVFRIKGHTDSVVYLCYSLKKALANQVSIFHTDNNVKSTSLEPGQGNYRISDEQFQKTVGELLALPTPKDRTAPPSLEELTIACTASQTDAGQVPYELKTHTLNTSYGSRLLVGTCSQKGYSDTLVQVFNLESGQSFLSGGQDCTKLSSDGRYMACNQDSRHSSIIDVQKSLTEPKYRVKGGKLFTSQPRAHSILGFYLDVDGCAARTPGPAAEVYADCLGMQDGSDMCGFTHWVDDVTLEGRWGLGGSGPNAGVGVRYNIRTKVYTFPNYAVRVPPAIATAMQAQAEREYDYSPLDESFFTKAEAQALGKTLVQEGKTKSFRVVGGKPTKWKYGKEQVKGEKAYMKECCGDEN